MMNGCSDWFRGDPELRQLQEAFYTLLGNSPVSDVIENVEICINGKRRRFEKNGDDGSSLETLRRYLLNTSVSYTPEIIKEYGSDNRRVGEIILRSSDREISYGICESVEKAGLFCIWNIIPGDGMSAKHFLGSDESGFWGERR